MKKTLKKLIKSSSLLNDWVFQKGIGSKVRICTLSGNFILNVFLRQNTSYSYFTNYKSTVIGGEKLKLLGAQNGSFASLVNSSGCYIQAGNGIEIGEGTIWASNVALVSANHSVDDSRRAWEKAGPIVIGDNCWIGVNVCILPEVILGSNTIVGAGSVVTKCFPQGNVVIAGNPAKIIKEL